MSISLCWLSNESGLANSNIDVYDAVMGVLSNDWVVKGRRKWKGFAGSDKALLEFSEF